MTSSSDLRNEFLSFFSSKDHEILPSSSLIPSNDPSLLFVNAGMVQFKDIFTGAIKSNISRATTTQKCVRAGGKHNDLEQVGHTARHHTFFEMLGNFSFGDYFKEEAIVFAWEFLTKTVGLNPNKLLVTVYHTDEEAASIWKKLTGFDDSKIIRISTNDNFWSMGETGPCGPCSEIFYDHGEHIWGGIPGSAEQDGDRFVEIWNLVFMQFERLQDGRQIMLPKPSIDTGIGLERLAATLQGVENNYETDILKSSISDINEIIGNPISDMGVSHKVIADHIRTICFLIADGVLPSNEGRGYVLRRIIRRAIRHAHRLGVSSKKAFLPKVAERFIPRMAGHYQELEIFNSTIKTAILQEEERFQQVLDKGLELLNFETAKLTGAKLMSGEVAFKLYDTFGFPLDLTQDILKEKGMSVDIDCFNACLTEQKENSKKNWSGSGDNALNQSLLELKQKMIGKDTISSVYEKSDNCSIVASIITENQVSERISEGQQGALVTYETCFYAESGGQAGDQGLISKGDFVFSVEDTKKVGGLILHYGKMLTGTLKEQDDVFMKPNLIIRTKLRANHSATHLLHAALRKVLGSSVLQKGSQVTQERIRFDFSFAKALSTEQIQQVEQIVNCWIQSSLQVTTKITDKDDAISSGAMALFGDKYGDKVRIITMKDKISGDTISCELCGGLHVEDSKAIGVFKIVEQSGIGSNTRRIEAISGIEVFNYFADFEHKVRDVCAVIKCSPHELVNKCSSLIELNKSLEEKISHLQQKLLFVASNNDTNLTLENGVHFIAKSVNQINKNDLRPLMDYLKLKNPQNSVFAIANTSEEGKVSLLIGVSENISNTIRADNLLQDVISIIGGTGGGGKPTFAQGGGTAPTQIQKAFNKMLEVISASDFSIKK